MKNLLLLLFMVISSTVYSQNPSKIGIQTNLSEIFKDNKKFTELTFSVDDTKGGVFIGRSYKRGCYIEHYNSNLKLVNSYDFELNNKHSKFLEAFINEGKLILVEAKFNRDENQLQYLAHNTELDNFNFTSNKMLDIDFSEFRKIAAVVAFVPINFGGVDSDFFGDMIISKDRKHFVITQDIKDNDKELRQIHVFNNKMEKLYSHFFEKEIKDRNFKLQNIDVDEKGTVYMLGKLKTEKARNKDEGGKYEYELYKIHGKKREKVNFDSSEKYVASLSTVIKNGDLFCVGFYSDRNDNRYKGLAHFKLNPENLTIESTVFSPFTDQFIIDKYGKDKDKELKNIDLMGIHVTDNNEIILTGEERYVTTNFLNGYNHTTYHFNDIICAKMDKYGKLIWARNINKGQASGEISPYLSFTSAYQNDKVYFFINGDDKVRKISNDRISFDQAFVKNLNLYAITIDAAGEMDYRIIIDEDESDVSFSAGNGILLNKGDDIIFQGRRKRKKQIAKLHL